MTDSTVHKKSRMALRPWIFLPIIAIVFVAFLLSDGPTRQSAEESRRQQEAGRTATMMAAVKAGESTWIQLQEVDSLVQVMQDPACVAKVESVFLSANLSDKRWQRLREFPRLRELMLYSCEGGDDLLTAISGMDSLEHLSIAKTLVTDRGMQSVASLGHLKQLELDFKSRGVTPEPLRGHPAIEGLVLPTLNEEWLKVLMSLPKLKTLDIVDVEPKPSRQMVAKLSDSLPGVKLREAPPAVSSTPDGSKPASANSGQPQGAGG